MAGIKKGDVVQLKSGGPEMTVNFVENSYGVEEAACTWFINNKKESSRFPVETLTLVTPSR
jgi:uncharacterized protein YodC (DUF2158 family)